jgi:hypothetical protein
MVCNWTKEVMRFDELFDTDNKGERWTEFVQNLIDRHGLEFHKGNQATVITSDDRKCVYRIWTIDPGYDQWLDYAQKHSGNPHVMRVLGKLRTVKARMKGLPLGTHVKFVKLEKLEPITDKDFIEAVDKFYNVNPASLPNTCLEYIESFVDMVSDDVIDLMRDYPQFFELLFDMVKTYSANDICAQNVMMRGNVPVLIDPFK